ncbi:hypothetical protein ACWGTI_30375 [Mesorhizobium sp. ArgA1]
MAATDLKVVQLLTEHRRYRGKVLFARRTQPLIVKTTLHEAVSEETDREGT